MLPISRILVPVDFSERCLGMMPYVRAIAERYNSEVNLLHVVNQVYAVPAAGITEPALMPIPQWLVTERTKQIEEFAVAELQGITVRRLVYEGNPESQIAGFAQDVQLVVMATRGYGSFRRFLIGSVAAKVLHDVSCPVLTGVHMEERPSSSKVTFSTIVCGIDLNPHSPETLAWASKFARDFGARLSIVHVEPSISPGLYITFSSQVKQEMEQMAREEVRRLQAEAGADSVSICIREGNIAREVCSFAQSIGADMLIIGRGDQCAATGRLRTNAYSIIRQAPCPVLSV
jgi:nucleotide-binding universal stress UspA family protein